LVSNEQISADQATILRKLLQDGRKSASEIAKETGLTREIVQKNYDALEQAGIITGATIHINYRSFGCKVVASLLIRMDPSQADCFSEQTRKNPEIYSVHSNGPKGNILVVTAFRTLQQLDEIKDTIRQDFLVSEIKTSIWTDVREMHGNLRIIPKQNSSNIAENNNKIEDNKKINLAKKKTDIDEIDKKIAEKLSENGRASFRIIAKDIGISADNVKRRYEKLTNNGVIKVTIQIDPARIGYQAAVIFSAVTSRENSSLIIEKITEIPDVISIMKTTGDYDLLIWVLIKDISQLLKTQDELRKIEGITRMDVEIAKMPHKWPTPRQYISTF
jgi:DNA-binding Lrp family transcriptional regulator